VSLHYISLQPMLEMGKMPVHCEDDKIHKNVCSSITVNRVV